MTIKAKFTHFLAVALLSSVSSFSTVSAAESNGATTTEAALPFWKTPHMDYVSLEVTVDDAGLSFWDVPLLEKAFIDATPADRKDGVSVGQLGGDGGNKDMIIKLAREIAEGKHGDIDSLLIAQGGKLLFESYYLRGRVNLTHPQVSATKTYTGLALGRAIQMGYLTMADLDKPVASFLKELDPTKFIEGADKITLHQALTMTTGIRLTEEQWSALNDDPNQIQGQKQVQAIFERTAPITAESQTFLYGTGPGLVMQVLEAVVPGSAKDFIKDELFGKMGIATYSWQTDPSGLPAAGWRASITSRAMVKVAALALNKGRWNGAQLVPEAFIAKATDRLIAVGDEDAFGGGKDVSNQGYGYFWWSADLRAGDKSYFSASAQGGGGQFIILIEELDLMVVVTAHDAEPSTLQKTAERILPAFAE
ncbi:serine hydrolase domain-containing protein [Kordiimonas lacus]|uniref:CubicO group peptidase, beta-lactamase class C family n=1 Tax=Kordiimonas lacus TaxID=637679 RepID=A0A1G7A931_9PROT|nr:serine hydrolase [Kordiimonas lacus]SDE10545.1 CubicO group peptidase, beta-lactamase class C family [Kordiimonas lacus]